MLAHQKRALADRAGPRSGDSRHAHAATVADVLASFPQPASAAAHSRLLYVSYICTDADTEGTGRGRGGRIERFQVAAILLLLRERPAHGYDLLERLPEVIGEERVDVGNLYRVLRTLEEQGLVASEWDESLPGPAKRTYELTDAGAAALDRWAAALDRDPDPHRPLSRTIRGEGGDHAPPQIPSRRPPLGARFYASENVLERLDEYQRDLEQELADVVELIKRLRAEEAPPQPSQTDLEPVPTAPRGSPGRASRASTAQ